MKKSFNAKNVRYGGKDLGMCVLEINDSERTAAILAEKGRFSKKMVVVADLGKVMETPQASGSKVTIGQAVIELLSDSDAQMVVELLYVPQVNMALESVKAATDAFLQGRVSMLNSLRQLASDPRAALLSAFGEDVPDADPVQYLVSGYANSLKKELVKLREAVESESKDLNFQMRNRIYAAIYAIGLIQNAIFQEDESSMEQPINLLTEACKGSYPPPSELRGKPMEEVTSTLLKTCFEGLQLSTGNG